MKTPRINLSDREWFYRYVKRESWTPIQNHGYMSDQYGIDHPFKYQLAAYEKLIEDMDLEGKDIVEIGCGYGAGIDYLNKKYGLDILGIDTEAEFIKYAREKHKGKFILEDFLKPLFLQPDSYDVVLILDSYLFFCDSGKFYVHLNDLVRDRGRVVISDIFSKDDVDIYVTKMKHCNFILKKKENITKQTMQSMEYDIKTLQTRIKDVSKEAIESYMRIQKHRHFRFKIRAEEQYQLLFEKGNDSLSCKGKE
tara:strand:- start:2848 stop:3603 length:756 start_codon:yes stop_codon:yes gene_type:complete